MAIWRVAYYILAVVVHLAQPHCLLCQPDCQLLQTSILKSDKVSLSCDEGDQRELEEFVKLTNFSTINSLTLRSPNLISLNITKFRMVASLDFSKNNITTFSYNTTFDTRFLNISSSSLMKFSGLFPQLIELDLSNNFLQNVSWNVTQTNKVTHLHLQNNHIKNISILFSDTLKYLDVRNNELTELNLGKCPNLKEVDASNNIIKEISINISISAPNIEMLNLSSNVIQELKDYSFNLTNLLKLDLRNNSIRSLSQKCFYGLNRLQYLDISLNIIQIVSPSTFQYLNGLIHLMVSDNKELISQDFGLLLATRRLKSVYASRTNQKKIPSSLTRSVRYLVLSFNDITQIQCGDLDSYPLLNSLDLTNNNISYIEDDALGRLDFLVTLNLNDNFLSTVPHTLPDNLKNLYLRNNKIKSINSNDFTELQQLLQLDLSFNKIKEIKDDTFSQLFNLEKLNLSGNSIITLPSTSITGPRKLKILDLSYLSNLTKCEQTLCFPVPEYNNLQELHMQNSSALVNRFMKDVAALKTFKQLAVLNVANSNLTTIRNDLPTYLPRINELYIQGNKINCSEIQNIFAWFRIKEIRDCIFIISEDPSRENHSTLDVTTIKYNITTNVIEQELSSILTTPFTVELNASTFSVQTSTEYTVYENKTELENSVVDSEFLTNELWFNNESLGVVDAYSAETPTSHPGLFILLLLPIALVSTCLFLNYSRIKKTRHHHPIHSEMDIEISNISSELW